MAMNAFMVQTVLLQVGEQERENLPQAYFSFTLESSKIFK